MKDTAMNNTADLNKSTPEIISGDTEDEKPISISSLVDFEPDEIFYDMHYEMEIGILKSGEMERIYPNHTMKIGPGQIWTAGMWEQHACRYIKRPCTGIAVFVQPHVFKALNLGNETSFNWAAPFLLPPAKRPQILSDRGKKEMVRLVDKYRKEIEPVREEHAGAVMQPVLLLQIIQNIFLENPDIFQKEFSDLTTRESINPALEKVFNSHGFVSSVDAAKECAMGESSFCRLFEKMMGISFAKFALENRVKGVVLDLMKTDKSVETIADEWGFCDLSHLHRVFIKKYGCTPGKYRKKHQKK